MFAALICFVRRNDDYSNTHIGMRQEYFKKKIKTLPGSKSGMDSFEWNFCIDFCDLIFRIKKAENQQIVIFRINHVPEAI